MNIIQFPKLPRGLEPEQKVYNNLRVALSNTFIEDPATFIETHGKRPEDLNGAYLRSLLC